MAHNIQRKIKQLPHPPPTIKALLPHLVLSLSLSVNQPLYIPVIPVILPGIRLTIRASVLLPECFLRKKKGVQKDVDRPLSFSRIQQSLGQRADWTDRVYELPGCNAFRCEKQMKTKQEHKAFVKDINKHLLKQSALFILFCLNTCYVYSFKCLYSISASLSLKGWTSHTSLNDTAVNVC